MTRKSDSPFVLLSSVLFFCFVLFMYLLCFSMCFLFLSGVVLHLPYAFLCLLFLLFIHCFLLCFFYFTYSPSASLACRAREGQHPIAFRAWASFSGVSGPTTSAFPSFPRARTPGAILLQRKHPVQRTLFTRISSMAGFVSFFFRKCKNFIAFVP